MNRDHSTVVLNVRLDEVLAALDDRAKKRTSLENVLDVLEALARVTGRPADTAAGGRDADSSV